MPTKERARNRTFAGEAAKTEQQEAQEKYEGLLHEAYRHMLNDERGRLVLQDILKITGFLDGSYTGNANTYYNEGKRLIGRHLFKRIQKAYLERDDYAQFGRFLTQIKIPSEDK